MTRAEVVDVVAIGARTAASDITCGRASVITCYGATTLYHVEIGDYVVARCAKETDAATIALTLNSARPLLADLVATRAERDEALSIIARLLTNYGGMTAPGDWACVECHPDSEILKEGFRCAYHDAIAITGPPK